MPMGSTSGVAVRIEHGRERDISAVTKATWAGPEGRDTAHTAEAEGPSERFHRPYLTHRQWRVGRSGALRLSPQISEAAVLDGAVTLTGQREGGAAPPSRWVRRARWTVPSTRGRPHLPLRRQAHTGHRTDRARNGRRPAARVMSPRTHPLSAGLAATGAKGPRTWSRWPTDRGRSPAQLLVRLKGARTPPRWAPLSDGTHPTRGNGVRLRIIEGVLRRIARVVRALAEEPRRVA